MVHAIQDIDVNAHKISSMSTESNEEVEALMDSSKAISKTFNEFIDKINVFNENVKQIDEIAAVINGIADETNLLSLNAQLRQLVQEKLVEGLRLLRIKSENWLKRQKYHLII